MLRDGQKWACDSCIRGHRVSNCNHHDRELKLIAPKGRPVKQCEHCRSARKDKSHHAKCDCGSRKQKDSPESEPKLEIPSCCCHKGNDCVCGINSEMSDMRQETIHRRRTMPVKSKPVLSTSSSDPSLPVLNGHKHKPVHNTHGQALMTPYPKPVRSSRPNSIHNPPYARSNTLDTLDAGLGTSRSADDMSLMSSSNKMYGNNYAAQLSVDSIQGYDFGNTDFTYLMGSEDGSALSRTTSAEVLSVSTGWFDSSLTTVTEAPGEFATSPSDLYFGADWNIPSTTSEFFSPSDLPLNTSQADLAQTISHSGESNYQSAPPLTASSSGAQSEIGEPSDPNGHEAFPQYWSGTVGIRDSYPLSSSSLTNDYGFPHSLPTYDSGLKKKPKQSRHRQTYSSGSNTHCHSHHSSDSTTVPDDLASSNGVNIGHLANLAAVEDYKVALSANQSASPEYPPIDDSEIGSISIPASLDDAPIRDDWYFLEASQAGPQSRDYSWLLDSA